VSKHSIMAHLNCRGGRIEMNVTGNNSACPICDAELTLESVVVVSEIISCRECGSELEVKGLDPVQLAEAPMEEEDWGE
jgi:alpha-aminoadipate/glutamate carrier protein LysW